MSSISVITFLGIWFNTVYSLAKLIYYTLDTMLGSGSSKINFFCKEL